LTDKTPGFYLKYVVVDENDNPIVHSKPVRILTAREFYEQRFIAAHVANTYASFADFMSNASTAVNLLDSLTSFSRSNYKARARFTYSTNVESAIIASLVEHGMKDLQVNLDAEVIAEIKKVIEEP
jgi:DNA-binding SARP family transcriptional activator